MTKIFSITFLVFVASVNFNLAFSMKIDSVSKFFNRAPSDINNLIKKDSSDISHFVNREASYVSKFSQRESSDISNIVNREASDISSFVNRKSSDISNVVNREASDISNVSNRKYSDINFIQKESSEVITRARSENVHMMKILEDSYRKIKADLQFGNSTCYCNNYTCGCCVQLVVEKISLNETGCVNISYLPDEYGFQFIFTLNGKIIISEKISVKNPPPVCAPIPYSRQVASVCIRFYNLDYKEKQFSGCADVEVTVEGVVVEKYDLGCIHIPPGYRNILRKAKALHP